MRWGIVKIGSEPLCDFGLKRDAFMDSFYAFRGWWERWMVFGMPLPERNIDGRLALPIEKTWVSMLKLKSIQDQRMADGAQLKPTQQTSPKASLEKKTLNANKHNVINNSPFLNYSPRTVEWQ